MSLPALHPPCPSADSSAKILKEASGVEPGWVEIMPRKRVTDHVRTWLLSAQTEGSRQRVRLGRGCPTFLSPKRIPFQRCQDSGPSEFYPFGELSLPQNSKWSQILLALPPKLLRA